MKNIRRAGDRGHANHGWLDTYHSFSFAGYHDPDHMGFRALRVLNEDRVAAGQGFGEHPHRDMEIVTIVLDGALEHRDSTGSGAVLRPGDVQAMSAGTGLTHSEFNGSKTEPAHFLQLWVIPERSGTEPRYADRSYDEASMRGKFAVLASGDGRDGSLTIGRNVDFLRGKLDPGTGVELALRGPGRSAWLHVIEGSAKVDGMSLSAGDAVGLQDLASLRVEAGEEGLDALVLDLD